MIVILKRDDLLQEHRNRAMEDLQLDHCALTSELIEQAELVVFVEGTKVSFLKQLPGVQSKDSFDVLTRYITSSGPTVHVPFSKKRIRPQKKAG